MRAFQLSRASCCRFALSARYKSNYHKKDLARLPPSTPDVKTENLFARLQDQLSTTHPPTPAAVGRINATLSQLRRAISNKDLSAIAEEWKALDHGVLSGLQMQQISRTIAPLCFSSSTRALEDIAVTAARRGATAALNALMLGLIRRKESAQILQFYNAVLLSAEVSGLEQPQPVVDTYDALAPITPPSSPSQTRDPGRVFILLSAITAHAMTNSFPDAISTYLANPVRVDQVSTRDFIAELDHNPVLQKTMGIWTQKLATARLVDRHISATIHLSSLGHEQRVSALKRFHEALIEGHSGPCAFLTPGSLSHGKLRVDESIWASLLSAYLKCRREDYAEKLWNDLHTVGVQTGTLIWTALFDGYDDMGKVDQILRGWNQMRECGVSPDVRTYRALISTLFNGRHPVLAMDRFEAFKKAKTITSEPKDVLALYNTVLHGLVVNAREQDALALLSAMHESEKPKPDIISYNTFLRAYGRRGDFKALAGMFRLMTERGIKGDVFTFSTILSALIKTGRTDAPDIMLESMQKQGVEPNVATFSAIIDGQMREQTLPSLQAALKLLARMEQEKDPKQMPNEVTYTAILSGLYRGQWLDPRAAEEHKASILERMKTRGIQPNRVTCHILMQAGLEYPTQAGMDSALYWYRQMSRVGGVGMSKDSWDVLLRGLVHRGEWRIAGEVVKDLLGTPECKDLLSRSSFSQLVMRIRERIK